MFYLGGMHRLMPGTEAQWLLACTLFWGAGLAALFFYAFTSRSAPTDPSRRRALRAAAGALAALPLAGAGAGLVLARSGARLREIDVRVPALPPALEGMRIAQLSDIHYGPFLGRRELERAVAMANETQPHLTVLTGDLISWRGDDLEACIRILRGLRAGLGIYGCHGNHEIYAGAEAAATRLAASIGHTYLRGEAATVHHHGAEIRIAGYDYQPKNTDYLPGAGRLTRPGAFNLLLSHNPDVFPRAAAAGFALTLAGHTHGGQVTVEILREHVNVARFFTPYVFGLYEEGGASIYVNAGLGTVGAPVRLGAPPEVALIRLCRA